MDDDVTLSPCDVMRATEPPPHVEFYEVSRLVTGLVIYPIICVVGLAGNSLALVVFSRPSMVLVLALVPLDLARISGDEISPSLAVTGDSLCTYPCYSKTLLIFCECRTPSLLWSSSWSLVVFWYLIHGYVYRSSSVPARDQPVSSSVLWGFIPELTVVVFL